MKWTILTLGLLCCGCATVNKAEELIGKVSAKVDQLGPAVTAATETAKAAVAVAQEAKAKAEAKADAALDTLAAKGAPVDGTAGELGSWLKDHPMEAVKDPALVATALTALLLGYKRKRAADALRVVVKGVAEADPEAAAKVKAAIKGAGGDAVRDVISAVKKGIQ
jgi:outer membrane murein-binding lipoprotein Lpp